jgi:hypothetical protein
VATVIGKTVDLVILTEARMIPTGCKGSKVKMRALFFGWCHPGVTILRNVDVLDEFELMLIY